MKQITYIVYSYSRTILGGYSYELIEKNNDYSKR